MLREMVRVAPQGRHIAYEPLADFHAGLVKKFPGVDVLDSSLSEGYRPAVVKIDVEGAEEQVLASAVRTITTHKPVVVLEHGRGGSDH